METNTGEREDDVGVWKSVLGDRSKIFKDWKWTDDEARGEDIRSNQGKLGEKLFFFILKVVEMGSKANLQLPLAHSIRVSKCRGQNQIRRVH